MSTLISQVRALLDAEKLKFDEPNFPINPDSEVIATFRMPVRGVHGEWVCIVRVFPDSERLLVYSILSENVPEDRRTRISELFVRINYGLVIGNFEMDWEDGEVRYKTSMDLESITPTAIIVRNLIFSNFFSTDRYFNVIEEAIHTEQDLASLLAAAEDSDGLEDVRRGFDLVDDIVH
jgi:hypothetical protein